MFVLLKCDGSIRLIVRSGSLIEGSVLRQKQAMDITIKKMEQQEMS
jgi:hypothetical protein